MWYTLHRKENIMSYGKVYKITNTVNGRLYIGKTIRTLEARWRQHRADSTRYDYPLYRAMKKYGKDKFLIILLQECETLSDLNEKELEWAQRLNSFAPNGYNLTAGTGPGADSEETKRKKSEALKGKPKSEEQKRKQSEVMKGKYSGELNPFYGKKHSKETKQILSIKRQGIKLSKETIEKSAASRRGLQKSKETRNKLSISLSGEKNPMFGRKGENSPNFGKKHTKEHRDKLAEKQSKTYQLISPLGELVTIKNLSNFCRENPLLSEACLRKVIQRKNKSHKGWRLAN